MLTRVFQRYSQFFAVLLLILLAALSYLVFVRDVGYLKDDWYLMYGAYSQGAEFFKEIFRIDRPARAYVMMAAYALFGPNPFSYHLSAYLWRLLAALSFWATLRMLWPTKQKVTWLMTLFFLLYPGFLSQTNPIDYQSQLLALFLAMFSIYLSLKALEMPGKGIRAFLVGVSVVLSIAYLSLVEYMLGLEGLRFLLIMLHHEKIASEWKVLLRKVTREGVVFLTGPFLFLFWRLFIFHSERRATDVGFQLGQLLRSPVQTSLLWGINWLQSLIRTAFLAWVTPFYYLTYRLPILHALLGFLLAALAALLVYAWLKISPDEMEKAENWQGVVFWFGLLAAGIGLIPVILSNRFVDFGEYSRYALASSPAAAMLLVAAVFSFRSARWHHGGMILLAFLAVFTHLANALQAKQQTEIVRNFWWQVSWRAPALERGTTLIASYPAPIPEEYVIWGAASLIYYPNEKNSERPVKAPLNAALLIQENAWRIVTQSGSETLRRRGFNVFPNYSDVLVLVQATPQGCVRILDGAHPELSVSDDAKVGLVAPYSQIRHVLPEGQAMPPISVFGPEPSHSWCYYYQKASLARQLGKWEEVARLGDEALSKGYSPKDEIEWMPLLQADVILGRKEPFQERAAQIRHPFIRYQACQILLSSAQGEEMASLVRELLCKR